MPSNGTSLPFEVVVQLKFSNCEAHVNLSMVQHSLKLIVFRHVVELLQMLDTRSFEEVRWEDKARSLRQMQGIDKAIEVESRAAINHYIQKDWEQPELHDSVQRDDFVQGEADSGGEVAQVQDNSMSICQSDGGPTSGIVAGTNVSDGKPTGPNDAASSESDIPNDPQPEVGNTEESRNISRATQVPAFLQAKRQSQARSCEILATSKQPVTAPAGSRSFPDHSRRHANGSRFCHALPTLLEAHEHSASDPTAEPDSQKSSCSSSQPAGAQVSFLPSIHNGNARKLA